MGDVKVGSHGVCEQLLAVHLCGGVPWGVRRWGPMGCASISSRSTCAEGGYGGVWGETALVKQYGVRGRAPMRSEGGLPWGV